MVYPIVSVQPPGLEEGSEPLTRVEDMARYFAEQIRAFRPVGPSRSPASAPAARSRSSLRAS